MTQQENRREGGLGLGQFGDFVIMATKNLFDQSVWYCIVFPLNVKAFSNKLRTFEFASWCFPLVGNGNNTTMFRRLFHYLPCTPYNALSSIHSIYISNLPTAKVTFEY